METEIVAVTTQKRHMALSDSGAKMAGSASCACTSKQVYKKKIIIEMWCRSLLTHKWAKIHAQDESKMSQKVKQG